MATGTHIRRTSKAVGTRCDISVIKAADQRRMAGTTVFDGARLLDGLSPDLEAHCARINRLQGADDHPTVDDQTILIEMGCAKV